MPGNFVGERSSSGIAVNLVIPAVDTDPFLNPGAPVKVFGGPRILLVAMGARVKRIGQRQNKSPIINP